MCRCNPNIRTPCCGSISCHDGVSCGFCEQPLASKIKLAIRKEPSAIPGAGFHYFLHPLELGNEQEAELFTLTGYIVVEVEAVEAKKLLQNAVTAIHHQLRIAALAEGLDK